MKEKAYSFARKLEDAYLDAVVLFDPMSFWHLTGTSMADACIVTMDRDFSLIVQPGLLDHTRQETWIKNLKEYFPFSLSRSKSYDVSGLFQCVAQEIRDLGLARGRIGLDETRTPRYLSTALAKLLPSFCFEDSFEFINEALGVNTPGEIQLLRKAAKIADVGAKVALESSDVGKRECEVAAEAAKAMLTLGADRLHMGGIQVLSGTRSSCTWSFASDKLIKEGEVVQIDFAPIFEGCISDISRVKVVGSPQTEHLKVFNAVLEANRAAVSAVRAGVKASEVDSAAREVIDKAGYAGLFTHHTGHPIGTIYGPSITPGSKAILREGHAFSIEPGIYLPKFGIRIEDDVVVTKDGVDVLTKCERTII